MVARLDNVAFECSSWLGFVQDNSFPLANACLTMCQNSLVLELKITKARDASILRTLDCLFFFPLTWLIVTRTF